MYPYRTDYKKSGGRVNIFIAEGCVTALSIRSWTMGTGYSGTFFLLTVVIEKAARQILVFLVWC